MVHQDFASSGPPLDYWHALLRRKWLALSLFLACIAGAGVLCIALPESYRSSTLILVEGQKIPENYVQAVIGPSIEERLNSLQQQVMSRSVLTNIIEEFKLYSQAVRENGMDVVIDRIRKDIRVETMKARSVRGGIDAFSISFAHEDPKLAMTITAKLASQFIEENLKAREQLVVGASEFLEQELLLAKDRLESQEKAVSHYKTKYMGELPEQVQANISALDRLQLQHSTTSEALQKSTDRVALLEKIIKEYEYPLIAGTGTVQGPEGPVVVVDPLVARLRELEKNLTALSAEYKDNYPDISYLKQEIQSVKAQLRDKRDAADTNTAKQSSFSPKEVKSGDLYIRELTRQRDEARLEIASLKDRLIRIRAEMKEYERRVEKAPTREQELEVLIRDYNNLKENYRTLLDKKLNARLAENLEKRQKGEQFRVMDPANLPSKPEKPDRFKIMLLGVMLGLGLGAGSAIGLELVHPVFRRSEDVESLLHLRVIASIPSFKNIVGEGRKRPSWNAMPSVPGSVGRDRLVSSRIPHNERNAENKGWLVAGEGRADTYGARHREGQPNVHRELEVVGKWNPWSTVAEQFRVAATRLALLQSANCGKVTVITSSVKGEGKSVVAANLAYTFARDMGKLTLLIDADLKCPTVHHFMGIPQSPGLREVLQGTQLLESCVQQEGELPLWTLPSGLNRGRETDDLSKIRQMEGMLSDLKGRYDYIIIDAPPVLPLADMQVIASLADTIAFVIRAGLTPRSVVESAMRTLGDLHKNTCIILNELEAQRIPYYMMPQSYDYTLETKERGYK